MTGEEREECDHHMCGIIAILRRPSTRDVPTADSILTLLAEAVDLMAGPDGGSLTERSARWVAEAAALTAEADRLLSGVPGLLALERDAGLADRITAVLSDLPGRIAALEALLDDEPDVVDGIETANAALVDLRDASWAVLRDRLGTHAGVASLRSPRILPSDAGLGVLLSLQQALSAVDRLEVRGRDSAGIQVTVWNHDLPVDDPAVTARVADGLHRTGSVRVLNDGGLAFVVKAAAEIGELGDNTAVMRRALANDGLLARALAAPAVEGSVLGHTRWASVGIISEPNAHPVDSVRADGSTVPLVTAVLNGDVDNHADLVVSEGLSTAPEITTDAKVVPALCAAHLAAGHDRTEAFRRTVSVFEGSVAIAAAIGDTPERLLLALRGSGQGLYVGLAEDAYVVASEPYGVVELTADFVRMDGETPADPADPGASRGQIVELDGALAGTFEGLSRRSYDGRPLPVTHEDVVRAEITTRDIDRGDHPHFLLKEIGESPDSVRATLRGRLVQAGPGPGPGDDAGPTGWQVRLGDDALGVDVRAALADGTIRRILVIGQGTAAVAGGAVSRALEAELAGMAPSRSIDVEDCPATELSGFGLASDMSDTLVVAISQSGTTTDTNRTVDLVRARGALVVAIVNRRNSDLVDRADGVLYTSDGRDVEMSVASTKAFYAQAVAGSLLAVAVADAAGAPGSPDRSELLAGLRDLPEAMVEVLALRDHVASIAVRHAPGRRYWAVVGSGPNLVAAREIRIKLSELCYKSIAADATEDKKHIDLSSEPLILVCATGLVGSTADDVAKEVAIYRAHKAVPVVVADAGSSRFAGAHDVVVVPTVHPRLAFLLSTVVGHLFGYEAARAIDAQAGPLRSAHAAIEAEAERRLAAEAASELACEALGALSVSDAFAADLVGELAKSATAFTDELRTGRLNGHLEASTAVRLSTLFRFALGVVPLESYQLEFGRVGTPALVLDDLAAALTVAIEELTRPIDAIKHQAKTVTVGISRTDETLLDARLAREVIKAGAPRDSLSYRTLRALVALDPAVADVAGYTRYRIDGLDGASPTAAIVDRGGVSTGIRSRTDGDPVLRGTKHRVAVDRDVLVTRGARDDRIIVLVPEVKDRETVGITLLHVALCERLAPDVLRGVLQGYGNRYAAVRDAVCETEPDLRDDLLAEVPVVNLLTDPVPDIADRLRT
ncbi:MAG: SIS domain-containing protein [Acidimicrobiales bacterium]|nr:SIS domain-containing protein [Acidimicrobiales bacterium]